jgi:hypothetical protein
LSDGQFKISSFKSEIICSPIYSVGVVVVVSGTVVVGELRKLEL